MLVGYLFIPGPGYSFIFLAIILIGHFRSLPWFPAEGLGGRGGEGEQMGEERREEERGLNGPGGAGVHICMCAKPLHHLSFLFPLPFS